MTEWEGVRHQIGGERRGLTVSTSSCRGSTESSWIVGMSLGLNVWRKEVSEKNCLELFTNESWSWLCGPVLFDITAECIGVYTESIGK